MDFKLCSHIIPVWLFCQGPESAKNVQKPPFSCVRSGEEMYKMRKIRDFTAIGKYQRSMELFIFFMV